MDKKSKFQDCFNKEEYVELRKDMKKYLKLYRRWKLYGNINHRQTFNYAEKIEGWNDLSPAEKYKHYKKQSVLVQYNKLILNNQ